MVCGVSIFFFLQAVSEISVLAMAAVNEIMGKNYIPLDFQDYLVRYCHPPFLYHKTNRPSKFLPSFVLIS